MVRNGHSNRLNQCDLNAIPLTLLSHLSRLVHRCSAAPTEQPRRTCAWINENWARHYPGWMTRQVVRFVKMQGCGNDFVVVNALEQTFKPTPAQVRQLADRHYGIGCDQVLAVHAPTVSGADFDYRIYNADGQEVGQCGNGSRAIAQFIYDQGLSDLPRLTVQTRTSRLHLERLAGGEVRVDLGRPRFLPSEIPLRMPEQAGYQLDLGNLGTVEFEVANLGNPHAVILVEDVDLAPVSAIVTLSSFFRMSMALATPAWPPAPSP